jgi:hypothetical protein
LESVVEHGEIEVTHEITAVVPHRRGDLVRRLEPERDARPCRLGIGGDRDQRLFVGRDVEDGRRPRLRGPFEVAEVLADQRLHLRRVDIADRDDGHVIGRVPVAIKGPQPVVRRLLDHLGQADGQPVCVARAMEDDRELFAPDAIACSKSKPPLLEHDTALLVDLLIGERRAPRKVGQGGDPPIQQRVAIARNVERVDRLVERGVRVRIGAEAQANRLEVGHQLVRFEVGRAIEVHVLVQMREAALVVGLRRGTDIHGKSQVHPSLRLVVRADEIAQAVGQHAGAHAGIQRQRVPHGHGGRRGWRGTPCRVNDRYLEQDGKRQRGQARRE